MTGRTEAEIRKCPCPGGAPPSAEPASQAKGESESWAPRHLWQFAKSWVPFIYRHDKDVYGNTQLNERLQGIEEKMTVEFEEMSKAAATIGETYDKLLTEMESMREAVENVKEGVKAIEKELGDKASRRAKPGP